MAGVICKVAVDAVDVGAIEEAVVDPFVLDTLEEGDH
jgi:hypothetical protein